jgi:hypothetical protein
MARHSRVKSSTTLKARRRVPSTSWSETKSIDHLSFGAVGGGSTVSREWHELADREHRPE